MKKKIVYIDMDGVVADFDKNVHLLGPRDPERGECDCPPNYFVDLDVIDGAKEALQELSKHYELFFLSTPQWRNILCWSEKVDWVKKHFGELMFKKLILSHDKTIARGHYLIDDRIQKGVLEPEYKHIHFGTEQFPNWETVVKFLEQERLIEADSQELKKGA